MSRAGVSCWKQAGVGLSGWGPLERISHKGPCVDVFRVWGHAALSPEPVYIEPYKYAFVSALSIVALLNALKVGGARSPTVP